MSLVLHMAEAGQYLAVRATAQKIAEAVPDGPLWVDFADVEAITIGFADELLSRLAPGRDIAVGNCTAEVRDAVEIALSRRGLSHVVVHGGGE